MKRIFNYLILLTILVASVAFGQQNNSRIVEGDIFPGIFSEKNYLVNFGAEKNVTTGVSSTMSVARITSGNNLLQGLGSFQLTPTSAGQTFSVSATALMPRLVGQNCQASLDYTTASGTTTNYFASVMSGTSTIVSGSLTAVSGTVNTADFFFPCPAQMNVTSQTTQVSLRITAIASTATQPLIFDKGYLGKAVSLRNGAIVGPWQSYTPTFAGLGTVTNIDFKWRRNGSNIEVTGTATTGTVTASQLQIGLPTGYITSTADLSTGNTVIGSVTRGNAGANANYILANRNLSYVLGGVQAAASGSYNIINGNGILSSSENFSLNFSVPIVGLSGSSVTFDSTCPTAISCENTFTAKIINNNTITSENHDFIASCSGAPTFVCTFNTGIFTVAPVCNVTMNNGSVTEAHFTALSSTGFTVQTRTSGGSLTAADFELSCEKSPPDYKAKQTVEGFLSKNTTHSGNGIARDFWITFGKSTGSIFSPTACDTSPCQIYKQDGAATQVVRNSSGNYDITLAAGTYSDINTCNFNYLSPVANVVTCVGTVTSNTNIRVACFNTTSGATLDAPVAVQCKGFR